MSFTKLKDARSTFSLESLRLNTKKEQNVAPPKGTVELYVIDNILYMMFDDGTEVAVGHQAEQEVKRTTTAISYQASIEDYYIGVAANLLTVTLPKASLTKNGKVVVVKNEGAFTTTVDGFSAETIDGALTITLLAYESAQLVSNGTDKWFKI